MVLVDVDITGGADDGYAGIGGYSLGGTGYTNTTHYLQNTGTNLTVATGQSRYPTGTTTKTNDTAFKSYFLFRGITIPQGSTIDDATFTFTGRGSTGVGAGAGQIFIEARKTASPTVPTGSGTTLFTKTVASNTQTEDMGTNSTVDTTINSDITSLIQELVDAFDYNNDNMMLMINAVKQVLPTGTTSLQNENEIRPFEFGGSTIANLTINYTAGANTEDFFVDALIQILNQEETFTIDSLIQILDQEETFTVDALLQATQTETFTIDALVQSQGTCNAGTKVFDQIAGNSGLWTEVDGAGQIEIDLAGSGVLEWNSLRGGGTTTETFAHRTISNFADNLGVITLRLKVDKISSNIPSGRFLVIQNNSLHPNPSTGSQMQLGLGTGQPAGGIFCNISDGTTSLSTTPQLSFANGTTRFLEGIYDPIAKTLTLNVYTDSGFSVHDTGSPVQVDASSISMTGLTFTHMITSNVKNSGTSRVVSADLDDFTVIGGGCPTFEVDALIQSLGDDGCTITTFFDTINDDTPWTVIGGSQIVVNDTAGVIEYNSLPAGANATSRYAHRSIPSFADNIGDIELKIKVDNQVTSFNSPTPFLIQIQEGTADPFQVTGSRMHISLDASFGVFARIRDGTNLATTSSISFVEGTLRFLRATFNPVSQILTMNVYTDANFTIHDTGSPVQVSTSAVSLTGATTFDTLTTGAKFNDGSARVITADLDDFTISHGGCPEIGVDSILVDRFDEEFTVNALIQALGENGTCPIPATETFYSRSKSQSLAERLGEGVNSPFAGITRSGVKIEGATHVGKAIEDMRVLGIRRNVAGATGSLFATVRSQDDTVIAISTNSVLAESLPTSGAGDDVTFTFDEKIVLQDGYRILLEFPNCIGCADSASSPNVFWFGTSTASPAGTERTFFSKTVSDTTGSYFETTVGFTQGGVISFTTSSAEPAEQRGCAEVDANLKGIDLEFDFTVDGLAFVPPAKLTLVSAIIAGEIEKTFTIDSSLVKAPIFTFTVDACIQQNNNEGTFTIDGHVFILPVRNILVDAIVRYGQGASLLGAIPDLIIQALRENPPTLTGRGIVVKVVEITTGDPTIPFTGKTSRIKNWLNRLRLDGLIQEDGSDPDWFETNWSLV